MLATKTREVLRKALLSGFLQVLLLLVAEHCNVRRRASNVARLAIPDYGRCRLLLLWLLGLFIWFAKYVRTLVRESSQVLGDLFPRRKTVQVLSLDSLLLLVLPLAVHHTDLKMISPVCLQDVLLAVRTLLAIRLVCLIILRLTDVVLLNLHVRV
jgi:hypothetical protein